MRLTTGVSLPTFELSGIDGAPAGSEAYRGKKLWLILSRFAACPFCSLRLKEVAERHASVAAHGVDVLAVFPSPENRVKKYVEKYAPPFRTAADPEQRVFEALGSETSWAGELRSAVNLPKVMKALVRTKMSPLAIDGAIHRMPSEYLVNPDGVIAHVHYGEELDDGFPIREVLAWASGE